MAGHWDHFIRYCWCGWHAAVDEEPVEPVCPACTKKPALQTKSSSLEGLELWLRVFLDPVTAIKRVPSPLLYLVGLPHNASRQDTLQCTGWLQEQSGRPLDPGDVSVHIDNGTAHLVGITGPGERALHVWAIKHAHPPLSRDGPPVGEKSS